MDGRFLVGAGLFVVVGLAACNDENDNVNRAGNQAGMSPKAGTDAGAQAGVGSATQAGGATDLGLGGSGATQAGAGATDSGAGRGAEGGGGDGTEPRVSCHAGAIWCEDKSFFRCSDEGEAVPVADCSKEQTCDVAAGGCTPQACKPGAISCIDGIQPGVCTANGAAIERFGEDCQAAGKGCWEGVCSDKICVPDGSTCAKPGTTGYCNPAGTGFLESRCSDGLDYTIGICIDFGTHSACVRTECTGQYLFCDQDAVFRCPGRHENFTLVKTCGPDDICKQGECVPKCDPLGGLFCKDGDIYSCDAGGHPGDFPLADCPDDAPCTKHPDGVVNCIP